MTDYTQLIYGDPKILTNPVMHTPDVKKPKHTIDDVSEFVEAQKELMDLEEAFFTSQERMRKLVRKQVRRDHIKQFERYVDNGGKPTDTQWCAYYSLMWADRQVGFWDHYFNTITNDG